MGEGHSSVGQKKQGRGFMSISSKIRDSIEKASWIRKMFEEGARLRQEYGEENVFDFSLGNPDPVPPIEFYTIMAELISERKEGLHGYMPNAGFPDVRQAIAGMVAETHGIDIPGENIVMTCGAAGGLNVVLKTILNPGDQVIVPRPYFVEYGFYIDNHGGKIVLVDTNDDFSLNIQNIKDAINDATAAVLINSPNNPTGRIYSEDEMKSLSDLLKISSNKGRTIYLVSDEPYREIVYENREVPSILQYYEQSIVVTSYSKSLSIPGERIGYIALNPACQEVDSLMSGFTLCNRILGFVNAPALMQRLVARLRGVAVDVSTYKRRRDLLMDGLSGAGYEYAIPQGAFYLFCRSPIEDDVEFVRHLQRYNILVVPGSGFGGPGYFRIAYGVQESVIEKAIPKFKEALDDLKKG
jgi:aspartate aminotransferase